jgi:hypothetical protein
MIDAANNEVWQETWTFNPFFELLTDAIAFDQQAQAANGFPQINRLAKLAFITATLSVEAAANACLWRMPYPRIALKQLDRLQTIEKYDLLLSALNKKQIDRGSKPFQDIQDLFELRNAFVHPKLKKRVVEVGLNTDQKKAYKPDERTSPSVKVPLDANTWTRKHSKAVITACLTFFNYFFVELCELRSSEVNKLLAVHATGPSGATLLLGTHQIELLKTIKPEYDIDLRFVNFDLAAM